MVNFRLPAHEVHAKHEDKSYDEEWEFETVRKIYERLLINSEYSDGEEVFFDEDFIELFQNLWDAVVFEEFIEDLITTDAEDASSLMNQGNAYFPKGIYLEALADYSRQ